MDLGCVGGIGKRLGEFFTPARVDAKRLCKRIDLGDVRGRRAACIELCYLRYRVDVVFAKTRCSNGLRGSFKDLVRVLSFVDLEVVEGSKDAHYGFDLSAMGYNQVGGVTSALCEPWYPGTRSADAELNLFLRPSVLQQVLKFIINGLQMRFAEVAEPILNVWKRRRTPVLDSFAELGKVPTRQCAVLFPTSNWGKHLFRCRDDALHLLILQGT